MKPASRLAQAPSEVNRSLGVGSNSCVAYLLTQLAYSESLRGLGYVQEANQH
jgi:hypothetical protein